MERLFLEKIQTRCLVRKTSNIERLTRFDIEPVFGDINDSESLENALQGVDTVIHLIGIIVEPKGESFETIHTQGTRNLVEACKKTGVRRFIYISALGARENARSRYHRTKWEAEQEVISSGMEYVILRPSIMIGERGDFIRLLSNVVRKAPIVPIIDGDTKVQPIYVENTVDCLVRSISDPETTNRIFEIAGPEETTYRELFHTMIDVLESKKLTVEIPLWLMDPAAYILERIMDKPPITTQQLIMLHEDNICSIDEMQEVFHLNLVPVREALVHALRGETQ